MFYLFWLGLTKRVLTGFLVSDSSPNEVSWSFRSLIFGPVTLQLSQVLRCHLGDLSIRA